MDEETGCSWLDRKHRCIVRRCFCRCPLGGMILGMILNDGARSLAATGDLRFFCRTCLRDASHAAVVVGHTVDREPMAMNLLCEECVLLI